MSALISSLIEKTLFKISCIYILLKGIDGRFRSFLITTYKLKSSISIILYIESILLF
jgi:hypothetical protein